MKKGSQNKESQEKKSMQLGIPINRKISLLPTFLSGKDTCVFICQKKTTKNRTLSFILNSKSKSTDT